MSCSGCLADPKTRDNEQRASGFLPPPTRTSSCSCLSSSTWGDPVCIVFGCCAALQDTPRQSSTKIVTSILCPDAAIWRSTSVFAIACNPPRQRARYLHRRKESSHEVLGLLLVGNLDSNVQMFKGSISSNAFNLFRAYAPVSAIVMHSHAFLLGRRARFTHWLARAPCRSCCCGNVPN